MTQPSITFVMDGRSNETAARKSIATLQRKWRLGDRLILLVAVPLQFSSTISLEIVRLDANDPTRIKQVFQSIKTQLIAYIPTGLLPSSILPQLPVKPGLLPWIPALAFPTETACESSIAASAWIMSTSLFKKIEHRLQPESDYTFLKLTSFLEAAAVDFGCQPDAPDATIADTSQRVLAIVPHYGCEQWLAHCLRSLLDQTRPPDHVVVVDDASATAPIEIVRQFPAVTLVGAGERSGPYRLIQQVIEDTNYWAYLFQDADDWSSCDRLQKLLAAVAAIGCELVGTQELRVLESELVPICYPLDVNAALREKPGHGLLHPTSLVTRSLVMRLGGFATGLRFGGDTEFLLRAVWAARVANIADYAYFRRKRSNSLTTDPQTGLNSPARQALIQQCKAQSIANRAAFKAGQPLCLEPLVRSKPIPLRHILGAKLSEVWS